MSIASRFVGSLGVIALAGALVGCGDDDASGNTANDEQLDGSALGSDDASAADEGHHDGGQRDDGGQRGDGGGQDGNEGERSDAGGSTFDDGALAGSNGASGTLNGITYTFSDNVSWWNKGDGTGNFSAYKGLLENWEIYGIPTAAGTYHCNQNGELPRIRLILGNQYKTTGSVGSCSLEVVRATDDTIEGRFTAELWTAFPPQTLVGSVTEGVFRKAP